jgi:hypothetical protein
LRVRQFVLVIVVVFDGLGGFEEEDEDEHDFRQ